MSVQMRHYLLKNTNFLSSLGILCSRNTFLKTSGDGLLKLNLSSFRRALGQTSLFYQDGSSIQELPTVVRNLHVNDFYLICGSEEPPFIAKDESAIVYDNWETDEMAAGFDRCYSAKGVFKLLELIPAEEVTPVVAVKALTSIFRLENNSEYRNWVERNGLDERSENFTRTAVLSNLVGVIAKSDNPQVIVDGLQAISRDVTSLESGIGFREQLCDQVLLLAAEGQLNVEQVCDAVNAFALLNQRHNGDKMWISFVENAPAIDKSNIMNVFRSLSHLRQSRKLVFSLAERSLQNVWIHLTGRDVSEILSILRATSCVPERVLKLLSGWLSTNIHCVSESDLQAITEGFCQMHYSEQGVEKTLEKYVKAKGMKIKNPALFCCILDYCRKFKFRSPIILTGCSEYFMKRCKELSPPQISSLFYPLGQMDFHPGGGVNFWTVLESELQEKFVQFHPADALDILLACVYLQKHPLNFVKKVFNPYFLDRLHSVQQPALLAALRTRLKILDTALTLECPVYRGPLLPRDHSARSLWQDGRIKRASGQLAAALRNHVEGSLSTSVILGQLPLTELYVVDVLIHPGSEETSHLPSIKPGTCTALLVHVPEHYDSSGEHLTGPQVMRRRHLRKIGLNVIEVDFNTVIKLAVHPVKLREHVIELISQ